MNLIGNYLCIGLGLVLFTTTIPPRHPVVASTHSRSQSTGVSSERLEKLTRDTVAATVERFGKGGLTADKIALTIIDLNDRERPVSASHRGRQPMYPASVVKLFYLAAAHHQMDTGSLNQSPEIDRALHDMIVVSSNDATHYIVDRLTATTAGPELDDAALREWSEKRNAVNRYFAGLGYDNINVNQKTWGDGPYGRERQGLGPGFENRNKLTTEAVARLLHEIVSGRAVSPQRSRAMMNLMRLDPLSKSEDPDDQATAFSGKSLPKGAQYFSKAGWTSTSRHDAAYVRLPNGAEYILVVFTVDNSKQVDIIPFVSKLVADEFSRSQPPADLLLINGRVWTGVKSQPWAEALASRGERPEQKITVEEAVRAYTSSCAYAEFGERVKGTLEIGKLSDVVVLSQDIFRIDPDEIRKTEVVYTITGGRVVHGR